VLKHHQAKGSHLLVVFAEYTYHVNDTASGAVAQFDDEPNQHSKQPARPEGDPRYVSGRLFKAPTNLEVWEATSLPLDCDLGYTFH
jgi:hypothetical protein